MDRKKCNKCDVVKPIEQFASSSGKTKDGKKNACKECILKIEKDRYKIRKDKLKEKRERVKQGKEKRIATPGYKFCPDCDRERPLDHFYDAKKRGDGKTAYCKKCQAKRTKVAREIRKEINEKKSRSDPSALYMKEERLNTHLALEDINFSWDEKQEIEFAHLYRNGRTFQEIADLMKRPQEDLFILLLDLLKRGRIRQPRNCEGDINKPFKGLLENL